MRAVSAPSPVFMFGAGEMADHVVSLMQSMGLPTGGLRFFDDSYPARSTGPGGLPVVGTMRQGLEICGRERAPVMIAIGTKGAAFRWGLYRRLKSRGVPLSSLVHPSVLFDPGAAYGENTVIMSGCTLAKNANVGSLCFLSTNATIEHDTMVGDNVFVGPCAVVGGHVKIAAHAFIGIGAVINSSIKVGCRAILGAGAVVVRDVAEGDVVAGVPARPLRQVTANMDAPTREDLERFEQELC